MAELTLEVGAVSASKTADNIKAARILRGMLSARGFDVDAMSNQEQADAVLDVFIQFANESATATEANVAAEDARVAIIDAPPIWED